MSRGRPHRSFALLFLGVILIQTVWLFTVAPFRAMDEFDHAQKADAVAAGHWQSPRTGLVDVRRELNSAALPVCLSRPRSSDNCGPVGAAEDGRVLVYSTASGYSPIFYAVVGSLARPFASDGYRELYVMRITVLLINGLLVALGLHVALHAFRTTWPFLAGVATLTSGATYAGMVVAPNGIENSCAFLLWMVLLAATFGQPDYKRRWTMPALLATGAVLGLLRALGPFWLACIIAAILAAAVRTTTVRGPSRSQWRACASTWGIACALGVAWTLHVGTRSAATISHSPLASSGDVPSTPPDGAHFHELPGQMVVWMLQVVGAIPYRSEPLPLLIYAAVLVLWAWLIVVGLRRADRSIRRTWCAVLAISIAVPLVTSAATLDTGWIWQGRYGWPLGLGLLLLAGTALEASPPRCSTAATRLVYTLVPSTMAIAIAVSVVDVFERERGNSPLASTGVWLTLPDAALVALVLVGVALIMSATLDAPSSLAVERGSDSPTGASGPPDSVEAGAKKP